MINSENHFRGFTDYFDKKIGQKWLFRQFLVTSTVFAFCFCIRGRRVCVSRGRVRPGPWGRV